MSSDTTGVDYTTMANSQTAGIPSMVRLPKQVKPEDITIDDLNHLAEDSFALWTQTSGIEIDGNKIDFDKHRYLLPIYMCEDQEMVWRKAAQLGATSYMLLKLVHWLHTHQGRKAGLYFPTKEGVENLSKDRLTPILQSMPELNGQLDASDKLGLRKVGKSSLYLFHLGGVASKDSVPLDFVAFDEVRLCTANDIDQALYRIQHSPYKKKIFMSTSGLPNADIDARFQLGTQHIWMSKCFAGDTEIWTRNRATGEIGTRKIGSLYDWDNLQALGVGPGGAIIWKDITAWHRNGVQKVVSLQFDNGSQVTCTPDHRFAVADSGNLSDFSFAEAQSLIGQAQLRVASDLDSLTTNTVRAIQEAGEAEVFDITVTGFTDRDHNFVLANGSVVHNCGCPDGCDLARTFPDCVVDDKKRGKLYLRCPKCKYVIHDPQNGRYVAHNPGAGYTSFSVSALVSKYVPLPDLWDTFNRTTNKAEFMNASLGLPFIDEENRGVSKSQLDACTDQSLSWAEPGTVSNVAMGVDVGGGYCYVVIADLHEDKKRIRHIEIIETDNPHYFEDGRRVSPFNRLRTLMKEYKVSICVVDGMPNYDKVLEFAQAFPGKVFAAFYAKDAKDVVTWSDKPKTKLSLKKAGPLLKFKHYCILSRFISMDVALGEWNKAGVINPDPDRLVQMVFDERTRTLGPETIMRRMQSMLMRLVKHFKVTNEATGEGRHEWIYSGGDPHFAHAWNYCNVALERLRRNVIFTFG